MPERTSLLVVALALTTVLIGGLAVNASEAGAPDLSQAGWKQTNGPGGGPVHALAIDPSHPTTIYRGSNTDRGIGVYKTDSAGRLWKAASDGLPGPDVLALAIDPLTPPTLYAGTESSGVFKTQDGALTWTAVNQGLPNSGNVTAEVLAIDPTTPSTLYVGLEFGRVWKSTDAGANWLLSAEGLPIQTQFHDLVVDPSNPQTLYVSGDTDLFRSVDGGASWRQIARELPEHVAFEGLAIDPLNGSTVYAATYDGSQGPDGGMYKTTDGGVTWVPINDGLPEDPGVWAVAVDPFVPSTVYAGMGFRSEGIYKSTDGGATWQVVETSHGDIIALGIDPSNSSVVYAGIAHSGVLKSSDGGHTWELVNSGIANGDVGVVAVEPSTSRVVYASCGARSFNGGRTWQQWVDNGLTRCAEALIVDGSSRGRLYAGNRDGVFRSDDGARTWTPTALAGISVFALAIDPIAPTTLYAGTEWDGVFKSMDAGQSWVQTNEGMTNLFVKALAIDPSDPSTVYAGTFGGGAFKSIDGGAIWTAVNDGLTGLYVKDLAIDPSGPNNVFAASRKPGCATSVFRSVDGGATWTPTITLQCDGDGFDALAIDPLAPGTIYAGHSSEGVFRSTDGGLTWMEFNLGLNNHFIRALAIAAESVLYAGTFGGGVYKLIGA